MIYGRICHRRARRHISNCANVTLLSLLLIISISSRLPLAIFGRALRRMPTAYDGAMFSEMGSHALTLYLFLPRRLMLHEFTLFMLN